MSDVAIIPKALSPAQTVARLVAARPDEVALAKAAVGQPQLPGQAALLAADAPQAQAAIFIRPSRPSPFQF